MKKQIIVVLALCTLQTTYTTSPILDVKPSDVFAAPPATKETTQSMPTKETPKDPITLTPNTSGTINPTVLKAKLEDIKKSLEEVIQQMDMITPDQKLETTK